MTSPDDSPDSFLERWSRRKIEAEREPAPPAEPGAADVPLPDQAALPDRPAGADAAAKAAPQPDFDLASLPSLDSITAVTDIRDFLRPACRRSSRVRPFAARGRPIRRFATSSASPRTTGTSPIRRRCPGSARCPRAPTSRGWWRRFSVRARSRTIPRLNLCRHPRPKLPIAPQALAQNRFRSPPQHRPARTLITPESDQRADQSRCCASR